LLPPLASAACKTNLPFHKANRFIDNQDGTVTDTLTNLIWMRCPLGQNWDATKSACEIPYEHIKDVGSKRMDIQDTWNAVMVAANNFNLEGGYAGATDWRVPNIKEMTSISMLHCYPPIDTSVFPDAASTIGAKQFWTSTPSRKFAEVNISTDPENPQYEYRTQAWTFSIVDVHNAGKALEVATGEKHHVMLVRDLPEGR
jgi:hypothetical protein